MGARRQDVGGKIDQGQVFVFSGADGSLLVTLDDPSPGHSSWFGSSLAALGDVSGDSVPDIVVGASVKSVSGNFVQGQVFIITLDFDSDSDGDLVADVDDYCPGSVPDGIDLNPNQYAANNFTTLDFEVGPNNDQSVVYDIKTTDGCTCAQIIEALGVGKGHSKKGCSPSVMEDFTGISANPDRKAAIGRK